MVDLGGETLSEHLRAALALNRERLPAYAALSGGASVAISRRLMLYERLTLPLAYALEAAARPYWRRGVPVLRAEFVSMRETPTFEGRSPGEVPPFRAIPAVRWALSLVAAYVLLGPLTAHERACEYLKALDESPRIHCMLRHMLESLARMLYLEPQLRALAKARGCRVSPLWASWVLFLLHVPNLPAAHRLDREAYPLQAAGLPILERDVPHIPVKAELPRG